MTTVQNAAALKQLVSTWVDRSFNFIDLQNAEKVFDNMLFEHIESNQTTKTANCFLLDHNYILDFMESDYDNPLEYVRDHHEDEYMECMDNDNYPMWNTLFEFREEPRPEVIESAKNAGFGVIQSSDDYNTMLFCTGCGYSFYGAHWIPMYLELPWINKDKYKGIDYSGQ